MDAEIHCLEI